MIIFSLVKAPSKLYTTMFTKKYTVMKKILFLILIVLASCKKEKPEKTYLGIVNIEVTEVMMPSLILKKDLLAPTQF